MGRAADNLADFAHQAGQHTGDALHRSGEALRRRGTELQKFFDDVEELLRRVSDVSDADIARVRAKLESSIERVRSATRDSLELAADSTRRAVRATDDYVHERPWTAVGISAAAGLLAGALLCRR
ncbi:MAG: DUF883 family protein [Pseudomonadota bacterium]|jgi:ElaB/YqjD/DUF883 family membrane-anchored ribosome-binding protein|nr:MAG: hypothetical protein DIU62_04025 [Pseudomonadota bacterium]